MLGYAPERVDRPFDVLDDFIAANPEHPYAVLGVARDADDEAVRAAYRRRIAQHHPDRLGDADAAARAAAEGEAARINAAWEQIRARRGMK